MKKINSNIFVLKAISAFFVVASHSFDIINGANKNVFRSLCYFSVLFFLLVSGYFAYNKSEKKIISNIIKIAKLTLIFSILYLGWTFILCLIQNKDFSSIIKSWFSINVWIKFFVFNIPLPGTPAMIWFLLTLLYCYISLFFITKFKLIKIAKVFSIVLILTSFILQIIMLYLDKDYFIYTRNFVFEGFSMFIFGLWIKEKESFIFEKNIPRKLILFLVFIGALLTLVERYYTAHREIYIGAILIALTLLVYAIKYPNDGKDSILEKIGSKYSLQIYLLHLIIFDLMTLFFTFEQLYFVFLLPIINFTIITLICYLFDLVKNKIFSYKVAKSI